MNNIPLGRREENEGGNCDLDEVETKMRVFVHHTDCAKIIGRGGKTMREIEARSRTKLKVQKEDEMDQDTKERYVDIVGTRAEQRTALKLLVELAHFCRSEDGDVLKGTKPGDAPTASGEAPLILEVLTDEVGRVLGRKGETVKVIETTSNTKIEVDKATGKMEIFGQRENQDKALELILQEVSYAKGQDGTVLKDTPKVRGGANADDSDQPPPHKMFVRDREAGRVIGRGGETVREIMEKSGADIKVQKSEEMKGSDRQILIFGKEAEQKSAVELVLKEVSWARDDSGVLKTPPEPVPKPSGGGSSSGKKKQSLLELDEENRKEEAALKIKDTGGSADGEDEDEERPRKKRIPAPPPDPRAGPEKGGMWVCGTCGGDHRSKDCPHSSGAMKMGVQMGMQMGMQATAMGMPIAPMMGMMGGPPGMMPPMNPAMLGMMGMPGMLGMKAESSSSDSSSSSGSDSEAASGAEGGDATALAVGVEPGFPGEPRRRRLPAGDAGGDGRPGERRRRRVVDNAPPPVEDMMARAPRKKKNVEISDL